MIDEIQIQNFQSLEKARLRLGRFTLILGESDLGKSSTLRAAYALAHNTPGQDTIRVGTSKAAVRIVVDGQKITWVKGASASYRLDEQVFDKTGRSVPDEVAFVLRMGAVDAGDVSFDPNFHMQWDAPFLVAAKPSERAKILGKLSGVTTLTLATQEARRREQSTKRLLDTRLDDLRSCTADLVRFGSLPGQAERLAAVHRLASDVERSSNRALGAEGLHRYIKERALATRAAKAEADRVRGRLEAFQKLGEFPEATAERARRAAGVVERLRELSQPVRLQKSRVESLRAAVAECGRLLSEWAVCPECGRPIEDAGVHDETGVAV